MVEARRCAQGAEHPNTLRSMNGLAWALHSSTDTASEAVTLAREALAVQARVLGAEHPDTLATQHTLAAALITSGAPADAAALAREVVDAARRQGVDADAMLDFERTLARALRAQGGGVSSAAAVEGEEGPPGGEGPHRPGGQLRE